MRFHGREDQYRIPRTIRRVHGRQCEPRWSTGYDSGYDSGYENRVKAFQLVSAPVRSNAKLTPCCGISRRWLSPPLNHEHRD